MPTLTMAMALPACSTDVATEVQDDYMIFPRSQCHPPPGHLAHPCTPSANVVPSSSHIYYLKSSRRQDKDLRYQLHFNRMRKLRLEDDLPKVSQLPGTAQSVGPALLVPAVVTLMCTLPYFPVIHLLCCSFVSLKLQVSLPEQAQNKVVFTVLVKCF